MSAKETVKALLDKLPDDCTMDEVLYRLYVVNAIEKGLADAQAGRLISHEEVVEQLRKRWLLGAVE